MQIEEKIASLITRLSFDELPDDVIERAKWCLLDFLGVAIAGYSTNGGRLLVDLMKGTGGKEEATLIADGGKLPSPNVAFANAGLGHALELDDGHYISVTHPGVVVIPSALALGEATAASGKKLIVSIVAGYETMILIGSLIQPSHVHRGFHPTGTCGTFGSAAAAAKLLELDSCQAKNAIRIASLQASGLLEVVRTGGSMKLLNAAKAAQSGVFSALLAKSGAVGPERALEGESGFFNVFADRKNFSQKINLCTYSHNEYGIREVYFKFYAACRNIHPEIEAVLSLMHKHKIGHSEIRKVSIVAQNHNIDAFARLRTADSASAKFSIPYAVAVTAFLGHAGVDAFAEPNLTNPNVLRLAEKVNVKTSNSFNQKYPYPYVRASTVNIKTASKSFVQTVSTIKGDPGTISWRDLESKFTKLVSPTVSAQQTRKLIEEIKEAEKIPDLERLLSLCVST